MEEKNFFKWLGEVIKLLFAFRGAADLSEKRILRDTIRAIVKELTRV